MLDPKVAEALDLMQEECAEIIQIISKIRRFGMESHNPYDSSGKPNQRLFSDETGDFITLYTYLINRGILNEEMILERVAFKNEKLRKYSTIFSD